MDNKKMVALNEEQLEKVDGGIGAIAVIAISTLIHLAVGSACGFGASFLSK